MARYRKYPWFWFRYSGDDIGVYLVRGMKRKYEGWFVGADHEIHISARMSPRGIRRTLVHELCHLVLCDQDDEKFVSELDAGLEEIVFGVLGAKVPELPDTRRLEDGIECEQPG